MSRLAAHGDALDADARRLAECADRLRALAARLRTRDAAPDWLFTALQDHITACVAASGDLAEAAARVRALAAVSDRPPTGRRSTAPGRTAVRRAAVRRTGR